MPVPTEIDFSEALKVQRQQATPEAAKRRMNELVTLLNTTKPMGADWTYCLYYLFLEYGRNFKLLMPYAAGLSPWLSPLIWGIAEILSYQAKRLHVKETEIKNDKGV
jgi:hypothetical protein